MSIEEEKLKIQRTQMYMQMIQIAISATLLYFLVFSKSKQAVTAQIEQYELDDDMEEEE
jgi:hypothetical protein